MSEAARDDTVVDVADYLRTTLTKMDELVARYTTDRDKIALRLAALDASNSAAVAVAVEDYERRLVEGRPYEDAEDAEALLSAAARRFVLP